MPEEYDEAFRAIVQEAEEGVTIDVDAIRVVGRKA